MTAVEPRAATPLRTLYLVRFAFAIAWAIALVFAAMAAGTGSLSGVVIALVVLYPLFDLACAAVDRRSSGASGPSALLIVNMALSLVTAIALVVAVMTGAGPVLLVWGLWAITAGAVQLIVGIRRYRLGGQWPMILSGGISVLAGASIAASSGAATHSITGLAGYATLGGIFFLISALRLRAVARKTAR